MNVQARVLDGGIGMVTLNNPPLNILTQALLAEMRVTLDQLAIESSLRVLILGAEGEHFSAGADVGEHLPPRHESLIPEFLDTIRAITDFPVPVIAVVRGRCLGGGFEVAQAADLIVAGEGASFGQPEILLGVMAPAACAILPARVAPALAAELLFTGDTVDAARAKEGGLVNRVVADAHVMDEALKLARRIARHSAAALALTKRALAAQGGEARVAALRAAGNLYLHELMRTRDAHEGLRAFMEKRKPTWAHQ